MLAFYKYILQKKLSIKFYGIQQNMHLHICSTKKYEN